MIKNLDTMKYDNELNRLQIGIASKVEQNLTFALLNEMSQIEGNAINVDFNELRDLADLPNMGPKDMYDTLYKVLETKLTYIDGSTGHIANVFTEATMSPDRIVISVNEDILSLLQNVNAQFTLLDLNVFMQLRSSYSKTLYRLLSQYKSTGMFIISYDELRMHFGSPDSYTPARFCSKLLTRVIDELEGYIENLTFELMKPTRTNSSHMIRFKFKPSSKDNFEPRRIESTDTVLSLIGEFGTSDISEMSKEQAHRFFEAYERENTSKEV